MSQRKKILLFNPPGKHLYMRDYFCSKISKGGYCYHPIDLLFLSGILAGRFDVRVIDAVIEKYSPERCFELAAQFRPDGVVTLIGNASLAEDLPLLVTLKARLGVPTIALGDLIWENAEEFLEKNDCVDGFLFDFTADDVARYFEGDLDGAFNMIFKRDGKIVRTERKKGGKYSIPIPAYDLFPNHLYTHPFVKSSPFASILTDFSCPFTCYFCNSGRFGYKLRDTDNVMEEIERARALGMKEIFFKNLTFTGSRRQVTDICERMIAKRYGMGWICWARVDTVDEELLTLMKRAGCHTIMMGVDTISESKPYTDSKSGISRDDFMRSFQTCKRVGIRTLATFIIGLPGDTEKSIGELIDFSKKLGADFASFNIAIPRLNTDMRRDAIAKNMTNAEIEVFESSTSFPVMQTETLSFEKIWELRNRAIREFYFRPSYIIRQMVRVSSLYEIKMKFRGLKTLVKSMAGSA